jgi:Ca2+-binding EF-hand superfamily protein
MSATLVEIIHSIRIQLGQQCHKLVKLDEIFKQNSPDGHYNFEDFELCLQKGGVFEKRQNLTVLYRHFDHNNDERVNSVEVIAAIKGETSPMRKAMIRQVWEEALGGGDTCTAEKHSEVFNAENHFEVCVGAKTGSQVSNELAKAMQLHNFGDSFTFEQFSALYEGIGASCPYDDAWFASTLLSAYGLVAQGDDAPPEAYLDNIQSVLWEKARQKTPGAKQESNTIRLAFQKLDLEDSNKINQDVFNEGLKSFGISNLPDKAVSALFKRHAGDDGLVDIHAFAKAVEQTTSL